MADNFFDSQKKKSGGLQASIQGLSRKRKFDEMEGGGRQKSGEQVKSGSRKRFFKGNGFYKGKQFGQWIKPKEAAAAPKRKTRQEKEDEEEFQEEEYDEEEEGGSSQDKYESDFINDGKVEVEEGAAKESKEGIVKMQSSEEEYFSKSQKTGDSQDE
mmetsp:Transcript_38160/g.28108  ORF Transcript_38160/g.28108 Transcript_38160/m.28108 type:complete len:157 (-) Transcript_38160:2539-3009(-)